MRKNNPFDSFDPRQFSKEAVLFLRKQTYSNSFRKVVVAVSGGVDSACVLSLCVAALGEKNVHSVQLPYGELNCQGLQNGTLAILKNKIPKQNQYLVNIRAMVDKIAKGKEKIGLLRFGNIIARVRMIVLFDLAKKINTLVVGTENKSEHLLGYFTRFGDSASDIEPIYSLYKTEVYKLANYLKVPSEIVKTPPTAGLWVGQTDERELGFSYYDADKILYYLYDKKMQVSEIVNFGFEKKLVVKVKNHVEKNMFKHLVPYVFKLRI